MNNIIYMTGVAQANTHARAHTSKHTHIIIALTLTSHALRYTTCLQNKNYIKIKHNIILTSLLLPLHLPYKMNY